MDLGTYLVMRYWKTEAFVFKTEAKINPPGKYSNKLKTGNEVYNEYKHHKYVGLCPKNCLKGEYLLDVDFPKNNIESKFLKVKFLKYLKVVLKEKGVDPSFIMIQNTPNGLHLFCESNIEVETKTVYSKLGIKFEIFSKDLNNISNLTILGKEYNFLNKDLFLNPSSFQYYLNNTAGNNFIIGDYFLKKENIMNSFITPELPIPPASRIIEGNRNNVLYQYANKYKEKLLIVHLNHWATDTPLGQLELNTTVLRDELFLSNKRAPVTEYPSSKEEKSTNNLKETIDPTGLKAIIENPEFDPNKLNTEARAIFIFLAKSKLAGCLVYIDNFYIFKGSESNLWEKNTSNYLDQKAVAIMLQQEDPSIAGFIISKKKIFFDKLASFVKINQPEFKKKSAFIGKTIDLKGKMVSPTKKEDYLTSILNLKLIKGEFVLKPYFMAVISSICGYSTERINLLRLAFNKLIFPDKDSQQIVFLYGGPKTGKSSIAEFIKSLHNEEMKAANFDALNKPFEASNLIHLKVIYIGDVTYLKNINELKKWQGRDYIQTERKFEHNNVSHCFSGTIFMTSNYPPERALGLINDEALSSRLLCVPLEFVIDHKNPYFNGTFNLFDFLNLYKEDVIYWALTAPDKLLEQPRADFLKYSGSNSCYGTLKENIINGKKDQNSLPINLNQLGPVRQFLEEKVKLTEQIKPLQKLVGYLFLKSITKICLNYFNIKISNQSIRDYQTDRFRVSLLDCIYACEFFDSYDNFRNKKDKKCYIKFNNDLTQEILFEIYFHHRNLYSCPFPGSFINLIDPGTTNVIFKGEGNDLQIQKLKEEFYEKGGPTGIPSITGKQLFQEYLDWLPVKPDYFNNYSSLKGELYNRFLDEVLVHLKGLFKYPFESKIRSSSGYAFLGLEWRDLESWNAIKESSLLRQFKPFEGEWLGHFDSGTEKGSWDITVKPCARDEKHPMLQVDFSFSEYFECPALSAIKKQYGQVDWDNHEFIHNHIMTHNSKVVKTNKLGGTPDPPPEQINLYEYVNEHLEKTSAISRVYILRPFIFHSGLISNRFDKDHGDLGSYLQFFYKNTKSSKPVPKTRKTKALAEFNQPQTKVVADSIATDTLETDVGTPQANADTSLSSSGTGSMTVDTRKKSFNATLYPPIIDNPASDKANPENNNFIFYIDENHSVYMDMTGSNFTIFREYDDDRINFLKNISWGNVYSNYAKNFLNGTMDNFTKRERYILNYPIFNFNSEKLKLFVFNESMFKPTSFFHEVASNWLAIAEALDLNQFFLNPSAYSPKQAYADLNRSLMLRPLLIIFWETTIQKINKKINNLLTIDLLKEAQNEVGALDSNTKVGNRWSDKNRNFSEKCFLPESAYLSFNNLDYGRVKFGKFHNLELKTKTKRAVTGPYASQHKQFKKICFSKLLQRIDSIFYFNNDNCWVYVLDIDLNKAHSNIGYGITQSEEILETERILATEQWEGIFKRLNCKKVKEQVENKKLDFEVVKKAIKALYYKGMQGGYLGSFDGVLKTFNGNDPSKEPPHKFNVDKNIDFMLKQDLAAAWYDSIFNKGLKAFPEFIDNVLAQNNQIHLPLLDEPINNGFTEKQTKKGSSSKIRIVSDVLTNLEFIQVMKVYNILLCEMSNDYFLPLLYEADGISVLYLTPKKADLELLEQKINKSLNDYGNKLYNGPSTVEIKIIAKSVFNN